MSRRSLTYLAVIAIASILGLIACNGENPVGLSADIVAVAQRQAPASGNGLVKAMSYDFDPNCMVKVEEANISEGGLIPDDYVLRVKLNLTKNVCDEIHLAAFFLGPIGEQELIGYASKNVSGMQSVWMTLPLDRNKVNKNCGISIQVDLSKGLVPSAHGAYPFTIADWRIGNPCGGVRETPSPTPPPTATPTPTDPPVATPTPTPTPHCNEEANAFSVGNDDDGTCDPTPTPTPTVPPPTSTPTPTPPTPTPTPTPVCSISNAQPSGCYKPNPWGNGNNGSDICGFFGLVDVGKDNGGGGSSAVLSQSATLAVAHWGGADCNQGAQYYEFISGATAGQTITSPGQGGISFVQYCGCPSD